ILDDWYDHTDGKKRLQRVLAQWRNGPQGQVLLRSLPPELVASMNEVDRITIEVHLLAQMADDADSVDLFRELLADVISSKVGRELMDLLLRRLNTQLS